MIQADATALPVPAHAFDRFFSAHLMACFFRVSVNPFLPRRTGLRPRS